MDFDDILEKIGESGRFQMTIYLLLCLPVLLATSNNLSYVFTSDIPKYRCFIPECETPDTRYDQLWLEWAIPNLKNKHDRNYKAAYCERFSINFTTSRNKTCLKYDFINKTEGCNEWIFDDGEKTIVNKWNITCFENQWKLSLVGTCHFTGIFIGCLIFGILADKFGRKTILIFCTTLMSISGVLQAFSSNYLTFLVLKFINALGVSAVYQLAFIMGIETFGKTKRDRAGLIFNYFFSLGEMLLALIAWMTKDWFWLQLCISTPAIIFIVYYWLIPESIRWLLIQERYDEAHQVLSRAAKFNGVTLPNEVILMFNKQTIDTFKNTNNNLLPVLKSMLLSVKLIIRFLSLFFIWTVNAFVFYGYYSNSLGGSKYLNFALMSLVEIPGYTFAWISIRKFGRRISLVVLLFINGTTCCLNIFVSYANAYWAVLMLLLIGKMCVAGASAILYVYTSEVLPTPMRSFGLGVASSMGRIGALLAPFVPFLSAYVSFLPNVSFGVVTIVAGLLVLKLPETLGKKLPDTVEDVIVSLVLFGVCISS